MTCVTKSNTMPPPTAMAHNDFKYNAFRDIFAVRKAIQLEANNITVKTSMTIQLLSESKIKTGLLNLLGLDKSNFLIDL